MKRRLERAKGEWCRIKEESLGRAMIKSWDFTVTIVEAIESFKVRV